MEHDPYGVRLIAEMLDDEELMVGKDAGRRTLLMDVLDQRLRRRRVAFVLRGDAGDVRLRARRGKLAPEEADPRSDVRRPRGVLAVPKGHSRRRARSRRDDDAVVFDGVHPPGRRAELEYIADARLVDEFLVQFAEPRPVGEIHGIEATIGNRAAIHDRDESRAAEWR